MKPSFQCLLATIAFVFFLTLNSLLAQDNIPEYNPETFQEHTKHIDPQIISIVINRFEDFTNDVLHELVLLSTETMEVSKAAEAKELYDKILSWKNIHLKQDEMQKMEIPTLQKNN